MWTRTGIRVAALLSQFPHSFLIQRVINADDLLRRHLEQLHHFTGHSLGQANYSVDAFVQVAVDGFPKPRMRHVVGKETARHRSLTNQQPRTARQKRFAQDQRQIGRKHRRYHSVRRQLPNQLHNPGQRVTYSGRVQVVDSHIFGQVRKVCALCLQKPEMRFKGVTVEMTQQNGVDALGAALVECGCEEQNFFSCHDHFESCPIDSRYSRICSAGGAILISHFSSRPIRCITVDSKLRSHRVILLMLSCGAWVSSQLWRSTVSPAAQANEWPRQERYETARRTTT